MRRSQSSKSLILSRVNAGRIIERWNLSGSEQLRSTCDKDSLLPHITCSGLHHFLRRNRLDSTHRPSLKRQLFHPLLKSSACIRKSGLMDYSNRREISLTFDMVIKVSNQYQFEETLDKTSPSTLLHIIFCFSPSFSFSLCI